jgi:methylmalonyl-CoA mutase N-terminal domain/subunit
MRDKNQMAKERKSFKTASGIEVKECYLPEELKQLDYAAELGLPGEYPFTRGIKKDMYRGRLWTMRQYAGFGTAEESNRRYKYLLKGGQTGLSVAFDLPTQIGLDSDHPLAAGEVGKTGVAIDTLEDMEVLLEGIPLDEVSTSMTINSSAAVLLALYIACAKKNEIPPEKLSGTIQNDLLKEYVARGTYIFPPKPSLRLTTDIFKYCKDNLPKWNTISISGYHMREAGATAVQEIAFTLANAICYIQAALDSGLEIDDFAPRISFFFNAHNNLFEEVAKFRAARRLYARITRERFGAKDPKSWRLRFHTQTAGCTLTAQQPENNIVRVTLQALAAVLGGTQSLHTNSFDEAWSLPTEKAAKIALRTQQLIAHESGIADTVDPLGGSYFVEKLTCEIEKSAQDYIDKIDQMGGALKAVESGFYQREIHNSAYRHQKAVESGEEIVVGVNRFAEEKQEVPELLKVDPKLEKKQIERLKQVKSQRDNEKVKTDLEKLKKVAQGDANLMPHILRCAEDYCSIGEICDVLREVWGEYKEEVVV